MNDVKKFLSNRHAPMILVLMISLVAGLWIVRDYGVAWDETDIYKYSNDVLQAYSLVPHTVPQQDYPAILNLYGPAYFTLANLLSRPLMAVSPAWSNINAWHFVYFLTFLAGALILYLLADRWMSRWAAFGSALLFLTQPLFWGHAFINPKDIPFMTFFLASIYLGLRMVAAPARTTEKIFWTVIAGIMLGAATSMRVVGPLAGFLVGVYAWLKDRRQVVKYLLPYAVIGAAASYVTWPYLWKAPVGNFLEILRTMANFQTAGNTLFWGELYKADQLPWYYFPTMFSLQLTEPLLLFALTGLVVLVMVFPEKQDQEAVWLLAGWVIIPAIIMFAGDLPRYAKARQLFFMLPPAFLAAGWGMDFVLKKLPAALPGILLPLVLVLPGIYSMVRLHPYEYIYYNALIGGTGGAYRLFNMDYRDISFKEATEYLDQVAPRGAYIRVLGPLNLAQPYARPDLRLSQDSSAAGNFDYAIIPTRGNRDERVCQDATNVVYTVGRLGAVFAKVIKLSLGEQCN